MRAALRSTAIFPLRRHGVPVGILAVYAEPVAYFDDELTDLLDLLATDLSYALDAFAARERRDQAEGELRRLNVTLEERVADRTRSLEAANRELEAFSYSVSHDLRAPLRGISGFSGLLQEGYQQRLDETGRNYLARVKAASTRMAHLIDDLLNLSRIARQAIHRDDVDLSALAREIVDELREADPSRNVDVAIQPGLVAHADPGLARIALANLIDNAWKFTSQVPHARIAGERGDVGGRPGFAVRDNGAGFDLAYADKLFAPFQRLHGEREFAGTGIGLAIVQRIVNRHGGDVRVQAAPGEGAAFTFTLG
jgi:light-regulated signal transduction histidine kinase (bacteriophytochrome)